MAIVAGTAQPNQGTAQDRIAEISKLLQSTPAPSPTSDKINRLKSNLNVPQASMSATPVGSGGSSGSAMMGMLPTGGDSGGGGAMGGVTGTVGKMVDPMQGVLSMVGGK